MLSYNLNTTLKSYVSEQAYLPSMSPLRGCVCNAGSKGLFESLTSNSVYDFLRCGYFFAIFFACLKYPGIFRFIKYCLYSIFYSFKQYPRFLFSLKHPLFKCLAFFFFFKEMLYIFSYRLKFLFRKFCEHFVNIGYLECFHVTNNKE